jgi:L-glyceraldehyde 3-phosphate reductase
LIASLDQSLKRLGLEDVDIFYHHRPDPDTPVEETMGTLSHIVRSGKALYVGISSYSARETIRAVDILYELGTPCLIHQPSYNMLDRWIEDDLIDTLKDKGIGCIVFSPLAQGLLSNRYLNGIPDDSRAAKPTKALEREDVSEDVLAKVRQLNQMARGRGQSLAQMAIAWILRHSAITSVLVGASSSTQIGEDIDSRNNLNFSEDELSEIDRILEE